MGENTVLKVTENYDQVAIVKGYFIYLQESTAI